MTTRCSLTGISLLVLFKSLLYAIVATTHHNEYSGLRNHHRVHKAVPETPLQLDRRDGIQLENPGLKHPIDREHQSHHRTNAGAAVSADSVNDPYGKPWLLHLPTAFNSSSMHLGIMLNDSTPNRDAKSFYNEIRNHRKVAATDGENQDALEHFFWGMTKGLALELGASEGTTRAGSMTKAFETMQWKRILIEGDPTCRDPLLKHNRESMIVSACICANSTKVHYGKQGHLGGIIEFMSIPYLKVFYPELLNTTNPQGDWSTADWSVRGKSQGYDVVDCVPLREILSYVGVRHINFAVIDVEGGEFDVLRSVDWDAVVFDVLVVETVAERRRANYAQDITEYLGARGYELVELQKGRNSWCRNKNYSPSSKPGLDVHKCWNGANRSSC